MLFKLLRAFVRYETLSIALLGNELRLTYFDTREEVKIKKYCTTLNRFKSSAFTVVRNLL